MLEQAGGDFNIANDEKEQALEDLENTRDRIESFDNLIKSTEKKIIDNKEKIISKMAVTNDIISYLFSDNLESKEAELHIIKLKSK